MKRAETGADLGRSKPAPEDIPARPRRLWFWAGGFLLGLLFVGISFFAARHLQRQNEILQSIQSKNAQVISAQAPELALSAEEREILHRLVPLKADRILTASEKEILARRFLFRPPSVRGLPSPPWDEKEFDEFLKSQEAQYRVSLERSYRQKLRQLFKQHYFLAAQAFETKNFEKARNEWILSLTFPVYHDDVQRHRGVALTMLRPFINDTLSKIGAMNVLLAEKDLYGREEKVRSAYGILYELLAKHSWEEANAKLLELERDLEGIGKSEKGVNPTLLPAEIAQVDSDIREVLSAQVAAATPSLPDWEALREDLAAKEKVIQSQLPATLETVRQQYEEAVTLLKNGNWRGAKDLLRKIDFPEELVEDARAKIKVLESHSLDSREKTG